VTDGRTDKNRNAAAVCRLLRLSLNNAEQCKIRSVHACVVLGSISRWTTTTWLWRLNLGSSWWRRKCHNSSMDGTSRRAAYISTLMENCAVCLS